MSIDALDSLDEIGELFEKEELQQPPSNSQWNGRTANVIHERDQQLQMIFLNAIQQLAFLQSQLLSSHEINILDLSEEIIEEITSNLDSYAEMSYQSALYHPLNREYALLSPAQSTANILQCRTALQSFLKALENAGKKSVKFFRKGAKEVLKGAKKTANFVKDHRKEILIGAGAIATGVGLYFLAEALATTAAGAGLLGALTRKREEEKETIDIESSPSEEDFEADPMDVVQVWDEEEKKALIASNEPTHPFLEGLAKLKPSYDPNQIPIPQDRYDPTTSPSSSCHVQSEGVKKPGIAVGFINGMNTSYDTCKSHLDHIKQFTGGLCVEGVYNHSNSAPLDLVEIFALNYSGMAPNTSDLLVENWTRFHVDNSDRPQAKYLQFTHSMGTIQTKVGLEKAPQEVRDRVIVIAIGPGVIIPEELCYDSYHYASKNDPIHLGQNLHTHVIASLNDHEERIQLLQQLIEKEERLIRLDPHPEANFLDHDFQSPTYSQTISDHLYIYLKKETN